MDCPQKLWPTNAEYLFEFTRRAAIDRVPLTGGMNLTNRCNLKCVHCYIRDFNCGPGFQAELPTCKILSILDEAADAGCLTFLLTGGEPLLHPDFSTIYMHARKLGILVHVFSNGTLLNQSHVELFQEFPPRDIEITLYGGTEETFDTVAGVEGAYEACHKGIRLLVDAHIPVKLKTMLLTLNQHELGMMQGFAEDLGVAFRFDPLISPHLNGDLSPLKYRVEPEFSVAAEMADRETAIQRAEFDEQMEGSDMSGLNEKLYKCGTGITSFFINSSGGLQPCIMTRNPVFDLTKDDFLSAWKKMRAIRDIPAPADAPCKSCEFLPYCGYCPPVIEMENRLDAKKDSYMCQLGRCRKQAVSTFRQLESTGVESNGKD